MNIGNVGVPEESIVQNDILHPTYCWVIQDIPVDEKENWQIDFFPSSDLLLFKAETFDFGKVRRNL